MFIESDKKWVVFSSGTIFDAVILPTCYFVVIFNEDYIFPNDFRYFIDNKIPELVFSTVLLHHNYLEKEIKDLFSLLTNEDFDGIQKKKEKLAQHSPFFHDYFFDSYLNYESPEEHSPGCHKIWKIGAFLRNRNLIS